MNKLNLSICILILILSCVQIGFGIWEAITLSKNNPTTMDFTSNMTDAYAFVMTKCILNLLTGSIAFIIGLIKMCIVCAGEDIEEKKESNKNNILQFISFGVNCWGIKLFNDYIKYNVDFGAYDQIIVAEFILFVSIIGLIILLCCGACCCICLAQSDSSETTTKLPVKTTEPIKTPSVKIPPINTTTVKNAQPLNTIQLDTIPPKTDDYTSIMASNISNV